MTRAGSLLLGAAAVLGLYAVLVAALLLSGRRQAARAMAGFVPDCVILLRRLLGDRRVPRRQRAALVALVAYLASPIDLIPDFIPVAGQLDDALVVGLALRIVLRASGPAVLEQHWPGPESSLALVMRLAGTRPAAGRC